MGVAVAAAGGGVVSGSGVGGGLSEEAEVGVLELLA